MRFVVRIFPNAASFLRLVRALGIEIHENWIEATRHLNMELLREHKREALRRAHNSRRGTFLTDSSHIDGSWFPSVYPEDSTYSTGR
jgi:hypothetical protein